MAQLSLSLSWSQNTRSLGVPPKNPSLISTKRSLILEEKQDKPIKKRFTLNVDLGEELLKKVQDLATKQQVKPAQVIRESVSYFIAKDEPLLVNQKRKSADRELVTAYERRRLRLESAISNNINQIAKTMNFLVSAHATSEKDVHRVRGQLQRILDVIYGHIEVFA